MDNSPQRITISAKTMIMALGIGAVAFGLWHIRSFVLVVLLAIVIASFVNSGVKVFQKIKIPRSIAVLIIYLLTVAIFAGALYLFVPVLLDELISISKLLPEGSALSNVLSFIGDGNLRESIAQLSQDPNANPFEFIANVRSELSLQNIFQGVSAVFGGVANLVLVIVISFYLSVMEDGVGEFLRIIVPLKHEEYALGVWHRSQKKIAGWFRGQVLLAIIQGISTYVGLVIVGLPYAFLIGIATILLSLIPYGILLAAVPAIAIAFFTGGLSMALIVFAIFVFFQQLETYIWQPLIIRSVTGIPSIVIIMSLVTGAQLAGLVGLLLAIPTAVVILEIIHDTELKRMTEKGVNT